MLLELLAFLQLRVAVLCREVGTLLVAFAPLDYSIQQAPRSETMTGFVVAGAALFTVSLVIEWRARA